MSAPRYPRLYVIDFDTDGPLIAAYFTQSPEGDSGCAPIAEYVHVSEVTRLRAALASIAALQTEPHVSEPHRGERHVDKKSAYYAGAFDGRADAKYEAAEMARAALVTT